MIDVLGDDPDGFASNEFAVVFTSSEGNRICVADDLEDIADCGDGRETETELKFVATSPVRQVHSAIRSIGWTSGSRT